MSSLLGEPFLLANYPVPSQNFPQSSGTSKIHGDRYVGVKYSRSDHGEGYTTVTVQGDGIHVLELSNMHAAASHTLGPSVFFATPAVTRFNGSDASTSYAVMRTAPEGIEATERDKTVWKWRDRRTWRSEEQPEPKQSVVFPHTVADIWAPECLPTNVIAVSSSGDVTLSDEDLKVTSSVTVSDTHSILLKSFVFGRDECAFILHNQDQHLAAVVICFTMVLSRIKLRIIMAHSTGELEEIAECDLGVHEDVNDISCDPSGYTTILAQRGDWQFFQLSRDSAGAITVASLDKNLRLSGLSQVLSANGGKRIICEPTIVSVGSSFVLLAGICGSDPPEIVLLLWDIQYSVVLATQKFALPSTVTYGPKSPPTLELSSASSSLALLVLSSTVTAWPKRTAGPVGSRSTVLVVPLAIPSTSTIALAMGKARDTQMWLRNFQPDNAHTAVIGEDKRHRQVMQSVRQAVEQGRPHAAETAFFAWIEQDTVLPNHLRKKDAPSAEDGGQNLSDNEDVSNSQNSKWKGASGPHLSRRFVSNILNGTLRPLKSSDTYYPSKIVQYLICRQAVSHAMVEGGLLPMLRLHRDWASILFALDNVYDLPEVDIVCILLEVVGCHRRLQDPDPDGMQVDAPSDVPSLPGFLAKVVRYASSPSMLRLALKLHLTDARDIICILKILEGWLDLWCDTNAGLLLDFGDLQVESTESLNTGKSPSTKRNGTPPLGSVLTFLQCVLDVHYLTLLQDGPSHSIVTSISRHLHEQLLALENLDRLQGPLEAFVKAQSQKHLALPRELDGKSRQLHKEAFKAAEIAIGLYQVEELVI